MKIELAKEQFEQLKDIVNDYREAAWHSIFEYQRCAVDSDEEIIKNQYLALAEEEEERHNTAKALQGYLESIIFTED